MVDYIPFKLGGVGLKSAPPFFNMAKKKIIIVKCKSGRFLAYYEHRDDIISSGDNERDAKNNLKIMYNDVMHFEKLTN